MLCLSCLLPGKLGKSVRKIATLVFGVVLVYAVCWALILKGLDFKMQGANLADQKLVLDFLVKNNSFGDITLKNLDFYNNEDEKVNKKTDDLPLLIKKFSAEPLKIGFSLDEYKSVELTVRILGLQKKFKTKINEKR
ncbi:uncharacterized protein VICG_01564 [Vittaforma corneae ATCC 50505]|uniref:Uncharacterized protein n=1 Tax=Vittaforma corneae (strain ATCC 50505) TaxID=993615 RepID=L2GLD8_VITCO|nr:uncharacterized protein VICG_01564 [Vittaforma corneae ATCC 50505]ELA41459.1 hypothetical protein VICG_01564 [Vittaforma corneae ATCC 50505]